MNINIYTCLFKINVCSGILPYRVAISVNTDAGVRRNSLDKSKDTAERAANIEQEVTRLHAKILHYISNLK